MDAGEETGEDSVYWDYAIYIMDGEDDGDIVIRRNFINSFFQGGIWIDSPNSRAYIDTNCVKSGEQGYSGFGMKFTGEGSDTAFLFNNIVFQNEYGVIATSNPFPILGDSARFTKDPTRFGGKNHLVDNEWCIKSDSSRTLKAELCWWGGEPQESWFRGDVDYIPWLDYEPSGIDGGDGGPERPIYALKQSYPNPVFGAHATIRFSVAKECEGRIAVYNVLGQQIRVLYAGTFEPGWQELRWDGKNQDGRGVSAGLYFYRFETPEYKATKKIVVVR
jgi:hypothetical protein